VGRCTERVAKFIIKGTEPIGGDTSVVFALDAGFDPYSFKLSSGPGSAHHMAGTPQDQQTSWADSSRAGQWYNGNGYVGVSSLSYGTLTVFRQNSLTYDGVLEYDPMGASYAFSPIGWQGITCGGGNTENCRHTTSLKYRLNIGQARVPSLLPTPPTIDARLVGEISGRKWGVNGVEGSGGCGSSPKA